MPLRSRKLRAITILLIILTMLLLPVFSGTTIATKVTATPKPVLKVTPTPTLKPTPTPVPQICVLTGRIVDSHGNGISGAKVTLYNMTITGGKPIDTGLTTVEPNPQYTSGGESTGYYQFTGVPSGTYDIMVDVNGMRYPEIVEATRGTVTKDFIITPVDNQPSITVTPAVTATPVHGTGDPIVTVIPAGPTPAENPDSGDPLILRAGIGILIGLQFALACIVLGLYMTRRV